MSQWFLTRFVETFNTGDVIIVNLKTRARPTVWERLLWPEPWERVYDQIITLGA